MRRLVRGCGAAFKSERIQPRDLERSATEGDSPVGEVSGHLSGNPKYGGTRGILPESAGTIR